MCENTYFMWLMIGVAVSGRVSVILRGAFYVTRAEEAIHMHCSEESSLPPAVIMPVPIELNYYHDSVQDMEMAFKEIAK